MNQNLPCAKYAKQLPCCSPDGRLCFGLHLWDGARGFQPRSTGAMGSCPWLKQVREWWKKNRSGKNDRS